MMVILEKSKGLHIFHHKIEFLNIIYIAVGKIINDINVQYYILQMFVLFAVVNLDQFLVIHATPIILLVVQSK